MRRTHAVPALLAAAAVLAALPALAPTATGQVLPTQVAVITFGIAGVPTVTLTGVDEFAWVEAGAFEMPAGFGTGVFYVRSDFWLGVGYRDVDICLESPSGECALTPSGPRIGWPCARVPPVCQGLAEGSDILAPDPGTWTVRYTGVTNAQHEIRVFAW